MKDKRTLQQKANARLALSDQDWEACKDWWRSESIKVRLEIQEHICADHENPMTERMSLMAQLILDRLLLEVWPRPDVIDPQTGGSHGR